MNKTIVLTTVPAVQKPSSISKAIHCSSDLRSKAIGGARVMSVWSYEDNAMGAITILVSLDRLPYPLRLVVRIGNLWFGAFEGFKGCGLAGHHTSNHKVIPIIANHLSLLVTNTVKLTHSHSILLRVVTKTS